MARRSASRAPTETQAQIPATPFFWRTTVAAGRNVRAWLGPAAQLNVQRMWLQHKKCAWLSDGAQTGKPNPVTSDHSVVKSGATSLG